MPYKFKMFPLCIFSTSLQYIGVLYVELVSEESNRIIVQSMGLK